MPATGKGRVGTLVSGISEVDPRQDANLVVGRAVGVEHFPEGRCRDKEVVFAPGNVGADEEFVFGSEFPILAFPFMHQLGAGKEGWLELVAHTKVVAEFALILVEAIEVVSFPFRLELEIVGEIQWAEVLLQEKLALKRKLLVAQDNLSVNGRTQGRILGIREIVYRFDGRAPVVCRVRAGVLAFVAPVGEVESDLEAVRDAIFDLVAKVEPILVVVTGPSKPLFIFPGSLGHGGGFVDVGVAAIIGLRSGGKAGERGESQGKSVCRFHCE